MATAWQIRSERKEKAYSIARASICMLCGIFPQDYACFFSLGLAPSRCSCFFLARPQISRDGAALYAEMKWRLASSVDSQPG